MSWKVCCLGIALLSLVSQSGSRAVTITITNSCEYTIWPVILTTSTGPTGFELGGDGEKRSIQVPKDWRGRVWGRTLCSFDTAGNGKCATGDCGTGLECTNSGTPPATLAEFGLNGVGHTDFYDVSLVDGFNVPMVVQAVGGRGSCRTTGCPEDLNRICPKDLQVAGNVACKSGCGGFGKPEYCCTGDFDSRSTCKPSKYSLFYKHACPRTYTYAYDDDLATSNCSDADYFVTFCPSPASHSPFTRPTRSGVASPPPPPPPSTHRNSTPSVSQNGSRAVTITITNSCEYTIWPVIFATSAGPTGFKLGGDGEKRSIQVPKDWQGKVWGRTLCSFDTAGNGKCETGDCGTGLECDVTAGEPPITLAEFWLSKIDNMDLYDVSLVDGFNVPMVVEAAGGRGSCRTTGCLQDLNKICPKDLQVAGNFACKSGCGAFLKPEYCCTGDFHGRSTCKPSNYSLFYKHACPSTYTYDFDDDLDTFNCSNADYFVTFCPSPASHRTFTRPTRSGVATPPSPSPPPPTHHNSTSGHLAPNPTTPSFTSSLPLPSFLAFSHVLIQVILFLRL